MVPKQAKNGACGRVVHPPNKDLLCVLASSMGFHRVAAPIRRRWWACPDQAADAPRVADRHYQSGRLAQGPHRSPNHISKILPSTVDSGPIGPSGVSQLRSELVDRVRRATAAPQVEHHFAVVPVRLEVQRLVGSEARQNRLRPIPLTLVRSAALSKRASFCLTTPMTFNLYGPSLR